MLQVGCGEHCLYLAQKQKGVIGLAAGRVSGLRALIATAEAFAKEGLPSQGNARAFRDGADALLVNP